MAIRITAPTAQLDLDLTPYPAAHRGWEWHDADGNIYWDDRPDVVSRRTGVPVEDLRSMLRGG